ncbi:MAG TPA: hypothetical protein VHE61_24210, partial [Opitutaceae bacterium]|nr:hypothetical protein [Opitutaceae bacterium]
GIIQYRRGRYDRAAALLEESSRSRSDDGEVFYYLGMSQIHLNSRPASVRSLRRALELNLAPELAEKVRDALAKAK